MGDNRWLKNSFVYLIILVAALALFFQYFGASSNQTNERGIATVIADAQAGRVAKISAQAGDSQIEVTLRGGTETYRSRLESGDTVMSLLAANGIEVSGADGQAAIEVDVSPAPAWGGLLSIFTILLPTLLLIGFFIFFMRQAQGSNNQAMSFGKSRARMLPAISQRSRSLMWQARKRQSRISRRSWSSSSSPISLPNLERVFLAVC